MNSSTGSCVAISCIYHYFHPAHVCNCVRFYYCIDVYVTTVFVLYLFRLMSKDKLCNALLTFNESFYCGG